MSYFLRAMIPTAARERRTRSPRTQARGERTRDRIERAALETFSEGGFDAATTREIAKRAGVKQQLITYHYGPKLELWKAAVDRIFGELHERFARRSEGLEGVDEATRVRLLLREFLLFNAEHPEVIRFMVQEGARPGPRLTWLYERHTRRVFAFLRERIERAQADGIAVEGDPARLTYVFMGSVAMLAQGAGFELLIGGAPLEPESLERYVDLVLRVVLPGLPSS
jgi:TetR/AcrR family transcriptional regulator